MASSLDDGACWLAIDPDAGRPLRRAAADLATLWAATSRPRPRLETTVPGESPAHAPHLIVLGAEAGRHAGHRLGLTPPRPPEHPEGYALITAGPTSGWRSVAVVIGRTERGTVAGVRWLLRQLSVDGAAPFPNGLIRATAPHYGLRGMYAHTAWLYQHPYALRGWSVADWQRYVDLLAALNLNFMMIWIPVGMLPLPISDDDARWLRRFREVVDYAHSEHGMAVWVGECANNLLEERPPEPIAAREYFTYCAGRIVDPGDPAARARLIENRSLLYRAVGNADGYWIIDGDPGGWDGSPAEDFVALFQENVAAIARCSDPSPTPRPLSYWMWRGWGLESQEANYRRILHALQDSLAPDRWGVLACRPPALALARQLGLQERTVYFPYGALEGEPSLPLTRLTPDTVQSGAEAATADGVAGVLGNTQTPLVQLPHHALWASAAWEPTDAASLHERLTELGRAVYPTHASLLADAWGLLTAEPTLPAWLAAPPATSAESAGAADDLLATACAQLARRLLGHIHSDTLGPAGPVGAALIPDARQHAEDLATMLGLRGDAALLSAALDQRQDAAEVGGRLLRCARRHVAWQLRHGYVRGRATSLLMRGSGVALVTGGTYHPGKGTYGPYVDGVLRAWTGYQQAMPGDAAQVRAYVHAAVAAAPPEEAARLAGWIEEVVEGKGIR